RQVRRTAPRRGFDRDHVIVFDNIEAGISRQIEPLHALRPPRVAFARFLLVLVSARTGAHLDVPYIGASHGNSAHKHMGVYLRRTRRIAQRHVHFLSCLLRQERSRAKQRHPDRSSHCHLLHYCSRCNRMLPLSVSKFNSGPPCPTRAAFGPRLRYTNLPSRCSAAPAGITSGVTSKSL